ncbi:MAG TPA: ATP-binding protein [Labilithrix sp.]|nr:ATP-binding protein [Labilithrix sp.]
MRTCREVAEVRKLLAAIDLVQGAFHEAVTEYLQGLHALGIDIPAHPDRMMAERAMRAAMDRLFSGALDSVEASPHEPTAAAACDLLASLVTPSAVIDPNLLRVVASLGAERALEAGNPSGAALAYSAFAAQLCGEGCYDDAERLALHACELVNRETDAAHRSWARIVYAAFLSYLSRPVPECLALLHRERDTASAIGDLDFASYAAIHATYFAFVGGENLKDVADAGETATAMASRANSSIVLGNVECMLQLVECLRVPANAAEFVRAPATEVAAATLDVLTHFNALYCEVVAAFLFGRHERASRACALAIEVSDFVTGFLDVPDLHFFGALAAARAPAKGHVAASSQRSTVDERHAILRALATKSPKNFGARDALVAAELARLRGDALGAERGYERAVHLARGAGQIHVEAIASECAATFHRDRGMQTAADAYLVQAHACYEAWGATSKATILAQSHPCLSDRPTSSADLASIVEIQRALSGAFRLPELHARLIDLVLEHASAKRGCILNVDHEQRLVVVAQSAPDGAPFGAVDGPADPLRVPFSMCNAAIRRQKAVFVADRIVDHRWMFDPHFAFSAVRSALCLPIVREDRVTALVYVEGDAEPGSFGPSALSALEAIGAQAAVALENARMYSCLEQENAVRRAAEAKLAQSQRLFIATLDASPLVVFMKDLEGRYLFINRRFEEIFLVGSQIIGKTDYDIFPRESADFFRNTDFRALAEDRAVEIDEIVAHGDGFHFYRTLKFSLRDESDKPWAICGIATDVTSRKRADEELRRSLSLLEATLDATHDAIIVFDLAGKVVRYNRRFVTMWQLPEEDFRGYHERELRSLVVDQLVDPASFGAISERGLPLDGETDRAETIAFKDGRVYEVVARPQRLGGKVVGRVVSIRDVSERMRAAEVRSQLLAEEKRARTDLEEAVRARDNFLSVASHELRTPLASVSLAVETLEASLSEPIDIARVRRSAAIAKRQVQRIVSLVDMLLDVSRLRSGKLVLSPAPVDLRTVIGEVSALLASELARSGSELVVNAPEPVVGNWDALRIEQVLTNLLTNAIKFGRGAPIVIELSRQGNQARLSVTDKGIGIPSDPRGRIFEAYTRLVSTRQFGGLGLGLHITKTIVEAHGGTLSVESQEGVGSTFTVTLPLDTPLTP